MQLTYLEAIRQGIWEEMERDPTVFCLGEDIGIYGGAFKVTDGFIDRFGPERVIDTPIAESAIVGAAFGASLTGMRPVAEFQFMDFIGCAFNQIINMVAKAHYRWGAPAPLVIRGPSGGNVHGGPFHSQNPEMWFVHTPGLKVVCPATRLRRQGPDQGRHPRQQSLSSSSSTNISTAASKKKSRRKITSSRSARRASPAKAATSASLLMRPWCTPRWKPPRSLAKKESNSKSSTCAPSRRSTAKRLLQTVRKTNKVIILHEHSRTGGLAGEIAAIINEEAFDDLDGPIVRIAGLDSPVPFSPPQEHHYLPKVEDVVREARRLKAY